MEKSRILTERLLVRIPEKEDINDIFLMMSDEHTAINTGFRPMSNPSEAEGKIRTEALKIIICLLLHSRKHHLML